jgi:hypothetical protein
MQPFFSPLPTTRETKTSGTRAIGDTVARMQRNIAYTSASPTVVSMDLHTGVRRIVTDFA